MPSSLPSSSSAARATAMVFVAGGGGGPRGQAAALAIRAGGRGDVNKTHVLWRQKAGTSYNSPVVSGDYLYCIDGTVTCLRTDTGEVVYKERLCDSRGEYPSPVAAGNRVFAVTRFDGLYVMAAGPPLPLSPRMAACPVAPSGREDHACRMRKRPSWRTWLPAMPSGMAR